MPSGEPEIFRSIQGEGVTAGTPAVFLRLATCNLACTWCDTKYTWDWETHSYDAEVLQLPIADAQERILAFDCPRLVITGGEPLLQQEELAPLVTSLSQDGVYCEVETNATIAPQPEMIEAITQWNVSPKTSSSGNRPERREVASALSVFLGLSNAYFKFVVVEPRDVEEVCGLVDRHGLPPDRVLLMPEGTTADTVQERSIWVAEACERYGFRFTTRVHILLWGAQRGR